MRTSTKEFSLSPDFLPYSDQDFGAMLGAEPTRTSKQCAVRNTFLVQLQEANAHGGSVHFSKRPEHYAANRQRYDDRLGYGPAMRAVETLRNAGIISEKTAPSGPNVKYRSLAMLLPEYAGAIPVNTPASTRNIVEPIRLKDKDGVLTSFRDNKQTRDMRRDIVAQNEAIRSIQIGLELTGWVRNDHGLISKGGQILNPSRDQLYRTFNQNSFSSLGRFYGAYWQNMPLADRKSITNNGNATVELDYPAFHPNLIAAMAGVVLDGDAYDIGVLGIDRKHLKTAFFILMNTTSEKAARITIGQMLCDVGVCIEKNDAEMTAGVIIQKFKKRHPKFEQLWCKKLSLKLQNIDGHMCAHVQAIMRAKGEVALSVYDSFIVRKSAESMLREAMDIALKTAIFRIQNTNATTHW